ncbi:MAG: PepSY-associated TM helix domain-containing protein [Pseudomonadota bacterium]
MSALPTSTTRARRRATRATSVLRDPAEDEAAVAAIAHTAHPPRHRRSTIPSRSPSWSERRCGSGPTGVESCCMCRQTTRPLLAWTSTPEAAANRSCGVRSRSTDRSAARQARSWVCFLHTGEALGLVGQTIAGLVSLLTLIMVWTGLVLAWRRIVRPSLN